MKIKSHFERAYLLFGNYNSIPTSEISKQTYKATVIAAFAKSLEFNVFLQRNRSYQNSFFYSPFLRGLCEDLIALKYLDKHFNLNKDRLTLVYLRYLLFDSIKKQTSFFNKEVPFQNSIKLTNTNVTIELENELKSIMVENGLNKNKIFPSVEHMAIDSNFKQLYDFLYNATSKMVHYSPNILLRMGWYNNDEPTVFSSHNFYRYYHQFNKFYAAYLFIEFSKSFKRQLGFKTDFWTEVKAIEKQIKTNPFYPELVTYEEVNVNREDYDLYYKILGMASKMDAKEQATFFNELPDLLKEVKKRSGRK
jgi:hypothetical protein